MEKHAKFIAALLLPALLCACSRIPDYSEPESAESSDSFDASEISSGSEEISEFPPKEFPVTRKNFIVKLNAEGGVYDGELIDDPYRTDYDGKGYVKLYEGDSLTHIVTADESQFYRVIIAARSTEGAAVTLQIDGKTEGAYFVPAYSPDDEDSDYLFKYYDVDNLYLEKGENTVKLTVGSGSADIDYLLAESSDSVSDNCYNTGNACVNPNTSLKTSQLMQFFSETYGKRVLTAQKVSVGTNAEIDAVYKETGRYPAIRASELALAVKDGDYDIEKSNEESAIALEWAKSGGIVAYSWHWYSPNARQETDPQAFELEDAIYNQHMDEIALLGQDELKALLENEYISPDLASMLNDIDKIALTLKLFDSENVPVIFEPLPDADTGLYWWGESAEAYKNLWTLVFDRLCVYHGLKNLIWVWNGSDMAYYPGDNMVDIIGQSFYENSDSSFAGRFSALAQNEKTSRKIQAVTACDTLMDIDFMSRDNAMWLWMALDCGEYIINRNGSLVETHVKKSALKYAYNHELFITRDELLVN